MKHQPQQIAIDQWPSEIRTEFTELPISTAVGEKLVYENKQFKVWTIHLEPGKRLPFHRHANPYFWTVLTEGESRSYYEDGSIIERDYKQGDTVHFADLSAQHSFAHNLENIGNSTLIFTTVEYLSNN